MPVKRPVPSGVARKFSRLCACHFSSADRSRVMLLAELIKSVTMTTWSGARTPEEGVDKVVLA
jgi:hypothetical protein